MTMVGRNEDDFEARPAIASAKKFLNPTSKEARALIVQMREALYNAPYAHAPNTDAFAALTAADAWLKANP